MNDPFDNIIKQARAISNPEQTVSKMDTLEAENKALKSFVERLIEAGNWLDKEITYTGSYWEPCQTQREWRKLADECQAKERKDE